MTPDERRARNAELLAESQRAELIKVGLLPNPDGYAMEPSLGPSLPEDPRIAMYESNIGQLAGRLRRAQEQARYVDESATIAWRRASRMQHCLEWLVETHQFDELTLEVIAHSQRVEGNGTSGVYYGDSPG